MGNWVGRRGMRANAELFGLRPSRTACKNHRFSGAWSLPAAGRDLTLRPDCPQRGERCLTRR